MSDIKLFRLGASVEELKGEGVAVEKSLQTLIEQNMEAILGVRLLASEHQTSGSTYKGRIDSIGIDEDASPVIIEYKRALNENVINQGLFYLDWLMEHQAEFKLLVLTRMGQQEADGIDWRNPRLICVASDFTHYDDHAVKQMNRNISLVRYKRFGDELLMLELANATSVEPAAEAPAAGKTKDKTIEEVLAGAPALIRDRYEALKAFMLALGDDVVVKTLKYYVAYRRLKNFACVEVHPQVGKVTLYLKLDPETIDLEAGFSRDVHNVGHFGTGALEVTVDSDEDVEKVKPLILKSYQAS
jgi:predicted transport protein